MPPGYRVFATSRDVSKLSEYAGTGIETLEMDVTILESIQTCRREVERRTEGKLDILINNAGRTCAQPALDQKQSDLREVMETNAIGPMNVTQAFGPLIIKSRGKIVMITTASSLTPAPFSAVYNASKAALNQYSESLRLEMVPFGVRVIRIFTGGVRTNLFRPSRMPNFKEDSSYKQCESNYLQVLEQVTPNMPSADDFALSVVPKIVDMKFSGDIWGGYLASATWFMLKIFPAWLMEYILSSQFGLSKVRY
ncbi:hypothetical protein TWF281_007469 [Arthrobotrys megalospora]